MGNSFFKKLFGNTEMRILMLGLDAAGKTCEYFMEMERERECGGGVSFGGSKRERNDLVFAFVLLSSNPILISPRSLLFFPSFFFGSAILYKLKLGQSVTTIPSVGFN